MEELTEPSAAGTYPTLTSTPTTHMVSYLESYPTPTSTPTTRTVRYLESYRTLRSSPMTRMVSYLQSYLALIYQTKSDVGMNDKLNLF